MSGLVDGGCAGGCRSGYYCAAGSVSANQSDCASSAQYYCPQVGAAHEALLWICRHSLQRDRGACALCMYVYDCV